MKMMYEWYSNFSKNETRSG